MIVNDTLLRYRKRRKHMKGKRIPIITSSLLLVWFFLDMVGVSFSGKVLVTRSWQDDGI